MPSIYISPYRDGYFKKTISSFFYSIKYITEQRGLGSINKYSSDRGNLDYYEQILNDDFSSSTNLREFEEPVKRTNIITKIYKIIFPLISILGLLSYILLIITFFRKHKYAKELIFLTAILLSYVALILGVSYTHISAFNSIGYYYLAPAYVIQLVFCLISFFLYAEYLITTGGKNERKYKSKYFDALFKRGS